MRKNPKYIGIILLLVALVAILCVLDRRGEKNNNDRGDKPEVLVDSQAKPLVEHTESSAEKTSAEVGEKDDEEPQASDEAEEEPQTEEEKREAEAEKKVDAFDNLTDKWMEPTKKGVTMADVDNFAKAFRQVPKPRQDECIHRALNLIPDENVMLLAGVVMDKTMDKEIVETVYNDILNRDEDVKKPILQEIFKDKSHPCWADTAWILDVTGELPGKK